MKRKEFCIARAVRNIVDCHQKFAAIVPNLSLLLKDDQATRTRRAFNTILASARRENCKLKLNRKTLHEHNYTKARSLNHLALLVMQPPHPWISLTSA